MGSKIEVPIFTDTNLGTHIALSVPPDLPVRDFKKQLETAHLKCFPESKEIQVYGLMVKRKSCLYRLPDSVPIKLAFEGVRGAWFLHVEARTSTGYFEPCLPNSVSEDVNWESNNSSITDKSNKKGKRNECQGKESASGKPSVAERMTLVYVSRNKKKRDKEKCFLRRGLEAAVSPANSSSDHRQASRSVTEVPTQMFSEVKSVTSIIKKYFPNSNEKASIASPTSSEATSKQKKKRGRGCSSIRVQSPKVVLLPSRSDRAEKPVEGRIKADEVGERLVAASNSIGVFASKKKYTLVSHKASLIKRSVFEISDSDD